MRVLHVHSGNIFGGVERILIALAGHKRFSPGFEHEFALSSQDRLARELEDTGAPVHFLPKIRLSRPWQVARARGVLSNLLRSIKFDLAIVHSTWSHCAFWPSLKSAGLPLIFWLHSASPGPSLLERWARRNPPRQIISVSHWVDQTANRLFPGAPSRVIYTPLPIDSSAFSVAKRDETRREFGADPNAVVILQASRMESWKGHQQLVEALGLIKDDQRWTCWITGESSELSALASERGIADRVRFLGPRTDVPSLLKAADIYCQPNTEPEGFSIAFLEAACAELPIVTSYFPTAVELLGESRETLCPPGDIQALAAMLGRLIADSEARQRLGSQARERALRLCDPATQFRALETIFYETAGDA